MLDPLRAMANGNGGAAAAALRLIGIAQEAFLAEKVLIMSTDDAALAKQDKDLQAQPGEA